MKIINRRRRAETNVKLLIALGVVAVIAAGLWAWRAMSRSSEAKQAIDEGIQFVLTCTACEKETVIEPGKVKSIEKNAEGMLKCPQCGAMAGMWGREEARRVIAAKGKKDDKPSNMIQP